MRTSKRVVARGKVYSVKIPVGGCVLAFLKGKTRGVLHPEASDAFPKALNSRRSIIPQKPDYADSLISYLGKKWGMGCV